MNRLLVALFVALLVCGCASSPPKREALAQVQQDESIVVAQKFSVVALSPVGYRWEYLALAGRYKAERGDGKGVYFFGADRPIIQIAELYKNKPRLKMGGIYVPDSPTEPLRVFHVFEADAHTIEDVDSYVEQRTAQAVTIPGVSGAGVAGNVVGGAIAGALVAGAIESAVGQLTLVQVNLPAAVESQIRASRRKNQDGKPD